MSETEHPTRRQVLMSSLMLPLAAGVAASAIPAVAAPNGGGRALVAFFSRSGNTRVIAGLLSRTLPADLFEIVPAKPYPADYFETVEQAQAERDRAFAPPLLTTVTDMPAYQTVYLGFPIWGTTVPPVIRSFLAAHDLSGKTLVPFVSHGGYGLGTSIEILRRAAPAARLVEGFTMQGLQERRTTEQVTAWLGKLEVPQ